MGEINDGIPEEIHRRILEVFTENVPEGISGATHKESLGRINEGIPVELNDVMMKQCDELLKEFRKKTRKDDRKEARRKSLKQSGQKFLDECWRMNLKRSLLEFPRGIPGRDF